MLHYDIETGDFTWLVRSSNRAKPGMRAGYFNNLNYRKLAYQGITYSGHRVAWAFVYGEWPKEDIDHIDGDPSNNRISNLRQATVTQNLANARTRKNKSGFRGVTFVPRTGKYFARLYAEGIEYRLGHHVTAEIASAAYRKKAAEIYGEFAREAA